jgi:hypothetical protein
MAMGTYLALGDSISIDDYTGVPEADEPISAPKERLIFAP